MKTVLKVQKINSDAHLWDHEQIDELFSSADWHDMACCPWEAQFPYKPNVKFQILHSDNRIYLRYEVEEEFIKAQYICPNENVFEDSCVEFFISLDARQTYYNFEFNVLGTGLISYGGAVKAERRRLDPSTVERVDTYSQVWQVDGGKKWVMILSIPKTILNQEIKTGDTAYANFYKCGDGLPRPHYLSWHNIDSPTPNFHQPAFFGELIFG